MARRKHRRSEYEFPYIVTINDWHIHASFNDYAYMNLFDDLPYEDRIHLVLRGHLKESPTKKVKNGYETELILHPGIFRHFIPDDEEMMPIGDIGIHDKVENSKETYLLIRATVPPRVFEHIRSYLAFRACGEVRVVGTDLHYRKGDIYYLSFDDKNEKVI